MAFPAADMPGAVGLLPVKLFLRCVTGGLAGRRLQGVRVGCALAD